MDNSNTTEMGEINLLDCAISETLEYVCYIDFHRLSNIYPPWVGGPPSPQVIRSPKAA